MSVITDLALYTLVPLVAMMAGGIYAVRRTVGPRLRSAIMHLAGGVVFAVVAVELLPTIIHSEAVVAVLIGFSAGTALMLILRAVIGHGDESEASEAAHQKELANPAGMMTAIALDIVIDGIMLGLGFAAGERAGLLLAVGLALETVSLGLALTTKLRSAGASASRCLTILALIGLGFVVGVAIGSVGLHYAPAAVLPGLLAFGAAALLFLVTEELLEEAHEVAETPVLTAMFFVGFLALIVLEMTGSKA